MRPNRASADLRQTNKLFEEEDILIGGDNYVNWLSNMKTCCLMKGKEIWDFVCGEAQEALVARRMGNRISQDDFAKELKAGNGMALGYIRAGVHGNIEHLICEAASPIHAMEILKVHCELELSRMHSVVLKRFAEIKLDLGKGVQVFLAEFQELEANLRRVNMEMPDFYKSTILVDALPDCMETDRATLSRISKTVSLQTLKTELTIAVQESLRRHPVRPISGSSGGTPRVRDLDSNEGQALSADYQAAVED